MIRLPWPALGMTALAALAGAAAAPAAQPRHGARYTGHSTQGKLVDFQVRPDGSGLRFYEWSVVYRCNTPRLGRVTFGVAPRYGNHRVPIRADGSFRLRVRERSTITTDLGATVLTTGHVTYAFSGRFTGRGRTATGFVAARFTGTRGVRCDSRRRRWNART